MKSECSPAAATAPPGHRRASLPALALGLPFLSRQRCEAGGGAAIQDAAGKISDALRAVTAEARVVAQELSSRTSQVCYSQAPVPVDVGTPDDASLPPDLRGKGLILGSQPVRAFTLGRNVARDGRVFLVDERAVSSLLADGNAQAWIPFTYSHEDDPEHGADNSGYALGITATPEGVFAARVAWTALAAAKLATGARGPVSPDVYCEHLDPETLETLTPSDPRYRTTNVFRPMTWRAISLVGVQALPKLPSASLSAQTTAHQPPASLAAGTPRADCGAKGAPHMEKLKRLLGLLAKAPAGDKRNQILASLRRAGKLDDAAVESQALAAAEGLSREAILAEFRKTFGFPDLMSDDQVCDVLSDALGIAHPEPMPAEAAEPAPAAPAAAPVMEPGMMANAAAAAVKAALPAIVKNAEEQVTQKLSDAAKAKAIDDELLAFERSGQLVATRREEFRERLSKESLAAGARQELAAMPKAKKIPSGEIISGGHDASLSVDHLPREEAHEILSRATAWALQEDIPFEQALVAVRGGNAEEQAFHSEVLAANPGWGTGRKIPGSPWPARLRRSSLAMSPTFDPEKLRYIGQQLRAGAVPGTVIPESVQAEALSRLKLAGESASFQPPTRYQVPGFGFGFYQGEYGGDAISVPVVGGANEQASYPLYGSEKLYVHVGPTGLPEKIGRNSEDVDESFWGVDWKSVTLHGYANRVRADRRDQSAGDAVLPMGVMASATDQALTIEKSKRELLVSSNLRDNTQYTAANTKDFSASSSRQWNDPSSTPIADWQGARITIWRAVGAFPEVSIWSPDAIETIRFHPDLIKAAQYAGVGDASRPNAMVPIEMLVSVFGPIVVPTCRISTTPGGTSATSPWGQDVIMAVVSKGKVIAPRAFATIVSAGYPIVKTAPLELDGLSGVDVVKVSDMYAVETVGKSGETTSAAYFFKNVVKQLAVVA